MEEMANTHSKIARLTAELRSVTKTAFDPPQKYKLRIGDIFSEGKQLGSENIERVRAMTEAAKKAGSELENMDNTLHGNLGPAVNVALRPVSQIGDWLRRASNLTSKDAEELKEYVQKEAAKRLRDRIKQVSAEAKRHGL